MPKIFIGISPSSTSNYQLSQLGSKSSFGSTIFLIVDSHEEHHYPSMQIKQLAPQLALDATAIVELHAIDPIVYVLYLSNSLGRQPVRDKKGKTIIYRSQNAARKDLIDNGVMTFDFVHMTAYDEIVGMPEWGERQEQRRTVKLESDEY